MRRALTAVLAAALLTACGGGGDDGAAKKDTNGCPLADKAFVAYDEFQKGLLDGTSTPADAAGKLKTVKDQMEKVALIAGPELKTNAEAAALSAGRLRVALSGGGGDVSIETPKLKAEMVAASGYCRNQ